MNTHPARGMRDFLPPDVRRRRYVIGVVAGVYERYGFEPLETPAVENIETLLGKYGEEGDKLIFRILKRGEEGRTGEADLALRYDLTVPLARVVAEHRARLPKFFKRYQVQPVWRADRPQKGRFREFYQCDVDAIGSRSPLVEAELLGAAAEVLSELGFRDFRVRLNHRRTLASALEAVGIPAPLHGQALVAIDKLDKAGAEAVTTELVSRGIERDAARALLQLFAGGVERAAPLEGLDDLLRIQALCAETAAAGHVEIDLSLARGLSYYTGAIFEIGVPDLAGSLAGGGRYDDLIGMFLGEAVPACGISLGLERILVVMDERGMFPPELSAAPAEVMVALWSGESMSDALSLARDLRAAGLRVDVYPEPDRLGRQFKYADARGIRFVALIGADEAARGEVAVKDLASGEQCAVPRTGAAAFIREHSGRSVG